MHALDPKELQAARAFAHAAAALASEAVSAVSRLAEDAAPSPAACRALALAAQQAERLDELARAKGQDDHATAQAGAAARPPDLHGAFTAAAVALEAAALALAETTAGVPLRREDLPAPTRRVPVLGPDDTHWRARPGR